MHLEKLYFLVVILVSIGISGCATKLEPHWEIQSSFQLTIIKTNNVQEECLKLGADMHSLDGCAWVEPGKCTIIVYGHTTWQSYSIWAKGHELTHCEGYIHK